MQILSGRITCAMQTSYTDIYTSGGGTARFASELIGKREVIRTARSLGKSRGGSFDQARDSTNTSERNVIEDAVLPAEIEQLPDLVGYLKLASRPEWLHVQLPTRALPPQPDVADGERP